MFKQLEFIHMKTNKQDEEHINALIAELEKTISGDVRFDQLTCSLYSTDASDFQKLPIGVVIPRNTDDVAAAIELAQRFQVPIIPRGGGSSLSGQTVGRGLIIDHSTHLNRILDINREEQ